MCTTVVLDGEWIFTPEQLEAHGIPVPDSFVDEDWGKDHCFCGVDVEGVLRAAGRTFTQETPGFYDLDD